VPRPSSARAGSPQEPPYTLTFQTTPQNSIHKPKKHRSATVISTISAISIHLQIIFSPHPSTCRWSFPRARNSTIFRFAARIGFLHLQVVGFAPVEPRASRAGAWAVLLMEELKRNLGRRFYAEQQQRILDASPNRERLEAMPVNECVDQYVPEL
jgi:hypothetical protein